MEGRASIAHVVCRITDDLLSKIENHDPESMYIIEALYYVDSEEYKKNNPSVKEYLDSNRNIIDKYKTKSLL